MYLITLNFGELLTTPFRQKYSQICSLHYTWVLRSEASPISNQEKFPFDAHAKLWLHHSLSHKKQESYVSLMVNYMTSALNWWPSYPANMWCPSPTSSFGEQVCVCEKYIELLRKKSSAMWQTTTKGQYVKCNEWLFRVIKSASIDYSSVILETKIISFWELLCKRYIQINTFRRSIIDYFRILWWRIETKIESWKML